MGTSMTESGDDFEQMWRDLAPLGRSAASGGYFRQPYSPVESELRSWFVEQCGARGLALEADGNGNLVAWWTSADPSQATDSVLIGSHLDSVPDGGAYDGPLGVVSALAAIDLLRERGTVPSRPIAVGAFAEEEGSRFGLACLGSRLASGVHQSRDRRRAAGPGRGPPGRTRCSRAGVASRAGAVLRGWTGSVASWSCTSSRAATWSTAVQPSAWPPGSGRTGATASTSPASANHAGTTRMEDRSDPMTTFAKTALAAGEQASRSGQRATFGRLDVAPNGTNAIPSRVTGWLDARCESDAEQVRLVAEIERLARRARGS